MRNSKTVFVAVLAVLGATMGMAQDKMSGDKMGGGKMQGHMMSDKMSMMPTSTMMMGLSKDEKKMAMAIMSKMTPAQKSAIAKKCSMCMMDKHAGMMDKMSKMDKMAQHKAVMDHMMSGLSKTDQMSMKSFMGKLSPKEMAVTMKMMENCCMHGMKSK